VKWAYCNIYWSPCLSQGYGQWGQGDFSKKNFFNITCVFAVSYVLLKKYFKKVICFFPNLVYALSMLSSKMQLNKTILFSSRQLGSSVIKGFATSFRYQVDGIFFKVI